MPLVTMHSLIDFGTRLLVARGVPLRNAQYIADVAVRAEAMGVTTHGLVQLTSVNNSLGQVVDPIAEPKIVRNKGASALIDGERVLAQICMKVAKELAVPKAKEHGVAMIGIGNTTWIAALGVHLVDLAKSGFCSFVTCQSSSCQDCAPFGGIEPKLSTNPIALAFPTGGDPVVADFSTATVAMGKVGRMVRTGQKAPYPIFLDSLGTPTDDPRVVRDEQGNLAGGSIMLTGQEEAGHKGYALSLWCEAMTALSGGRTNDPKAPGRQSFSLTVIDPEAFAGKKHFDVEMKRLSKWIKTSRPRPGRAPVRLPGEQGFENLRKAEKAGVPVDEKMLQQLNDLAVQHGVPGLTAC